MAITEYYVDPAIDANSGTGTIGDPFGDLQYALDTVTRDGTNGDRFNIKAGTAEVLTAALSLATYGTPTAAAPLWFQGYTSAAGDGGIGEISGAGSYSIYYNNNSSSTVLKFQHLKMGNCGGADIVRNYYSSSSTSRLTLIQCELYGSSSGWGIYLGQGGTMVGCYVHSLSTVHGIYGNAGTGYAGNYTIVGNYLDIGSSNNAIWLIGSEGIIANNIIKMSAAGATGINLNYGNFKIISNTIYQSSSGTKTLIPFAEICLNNLVVGASGTGGVGIVKGNISGGNATYNCTTSFSGSSYTDLGGDITLSSSPFVNAAGGNFEIDGDSDASEAAWPQAWKGLATTANAADIGAVQSGAGSGGGVSIYTRSVRVIKG